MKADTNFLYLADCVSVLERIDPEQAQLVYIDPPLYSEAPHLPPTKLEEAERELGEAEEANISKMLRESPGAPQGARSNQAPGTDYSRRLEEYCRRRLEEYNRERLRDHLLFVSKVLQQSHRVLLSSGTLFFHTRPPLTNNVRLILDQVFRSMNFRQEIAWPQHRLRMLRGSEPSVGHDTILFYSKSDSFTFNLQFRPLSEAERRVRFDREDDYGPYRQLPLTVPLSRPGAQFEWKGAYPPAGHSWRYSKAGLDELEASGRIVWNVGGGLPRLKLYLDEEAREPVGDMWNDIAPLVPPGGSHHFPSQQPLALVERIILTGSNQGDLVIDPCAGSGTALVAAQSLGRRWLGCELSSDGYEISARRLQSTFGLQLGVDFRVGNQGDVEKVARVNHSYFSVATSTENLDPASRVRFVLNQPIEIEETRHTEFKEVKGANPVDTIKNAADEYVVAFLNSEGGRIFWGIREPDKLVDRPRAIGVRLTLPQCDEVRRVVTEKLNAIRPAIDPTFYLINIHSVQGDDGALVPDCRVVEIVVPRVSMKDPYYTGSNEMFVKTDGGKKKLSGPELTDWIKRRWEL